MLKDKLSNSVHSNVFTNFSVSVGNGISLIQLDTCIMASKNIYVNLVVKKQRKIENTNDDWQCHETDT